MDFDSIFKKENIKYVFDMEEQGGCFIAEAADFYSEPMKREDFGREWAWGFPAGRYVIVVFQKHSLFIGGKKVWSNGLFDYTAGQDSRYKSPCFAVILDKALEYEPKSWNRKLLSHIVRNEKAPLQAWVSGLREAEELARSWSEQGVRAAVVEWFEDYDMY